MSEPNFKLMAESLAEALLAWDVEYSEPLDAHADMQTFAAALRDAYECGQEDAREAILAVMDAPEAPYQTWEMTEIIRARSNKGGDL